MEDLVKSLAQFNIGPLSTSDEDFVLALEKDILGATLSDDLAHTSRPASAIWGRAEPPASGKGVGKRFLVDPKLPFQQGNPCREPFDELTHIDYKLQGIVTDVAGALDALGSTAGNPEENAVKKLESSMKLIEKSLTHIRNILGSTDEEQRLQEAMVERYEGILSGMEQALTTIQSRKTAQSPPHVYNNRHHFESRLEDKDPITLFAAFIIIVLNVFGGLVREWASTALKLQIELLKLAFNRQTGGITAHNEDLLKGFPKDIRTARKLFDVEPTTTTYAACPACSATYRVEEGKTLPIKCDWKRYPNAKTCGAKISKLVLQDGDGDRRMVRVPIRPFLIQDFDAFKASLLSRPGMEAMLDRGTLFNDAEDMWDIKDGTRVKELGGPDGATFWDGLKRRELRLIWSLSIDWFNPRGNKAAGKSTSTGSIAMACLNLPPSLRYKLENLFLVGVIPGPREPSVEEVGHFVEPIVDMLDRSWRNGTKFDCTESSDCGRTERSMLVVIVTDLVASRKITGVASHSSKFFFCSLCGLAKPNINNLDRMTWPTRTRAMQKKAAEEWRDATTKKEQKRLFAQTGVRWSPFWKLDYYDPTKMGAVDTMHNLFLGLVQFHVREVLGIEEVQADASRPVTDKEINGAKHALATLNTKALDGVRIPVLRELCTQNGIDLGAKKKFKKKNLVQILKAHAQDNMSSSPPSVRSNDWLDVLIIGNGYFEQPMHGKKAHEVFVDKVTKQELKLLQKDIESIIRPPYRQAPPRELGNPGHGKLKADQWKTCIEFDIPVSVAQLWSRETSPPGQDRDVTARRDKVFQSIMHLAVAIRWGTSYRISERHSQLFEENMVAYLRLLLELYPNIQFRPNHHTALHIGPLLTQLGPVHSWWMFPFERVIGILQKVNTNSKMGELEATMLKTFCAGANLKALLQGDRCPSALKMAIPLLERKWDQGQQTGTIGELNSLGNSGETRKVDNGKPLLLLRNVYDNAFRIAFEEVSRTLPRARDDNWRSAKKHERVDIGGKLFATKHQSRHNAEVFFKPLDGEDLLPGVITGIVSIEDGDQEVFVLSIQPRKPAPAYVKNPFARYPDFGAQLWSTEFQEETLCIPATQPICHSESRTWVTGGVVVLKAISSVI